MRLEVLAFAHVRDIVGRASIEVDVPAGATVRALLDALYERWPGLRDLRLRVAVNHAYAREDGSLGEGDEVALIPPVSGG